MGNLYGLWFMPQISTIPKRTFSGSGSVYLAPILQKFYSDACCLGTFVTEAAENMGNEVDIAAQKRSKSWEI